jgi:putative drug exporter of the RND superfamily
MARARLERLLEGLIGGVGALVILLFVLGTLTAVLVPLAVALAAILNTFTLVWALTYITDVSIIVQFLIALIGLGVAIDYALLMIFVSARRWHWVCCR